MESINRPLNSVTPTGKTQPRETPGKVTLPLSALDEKKFLLVRESIGKRHDIHSRIIRISLENGYLEVRSFSRGVWTLEFTTPNEIEIAPIREDGS